MDRPVLSADELEMARDGVEVIDEDADEIVDDEADDVRDDVPFDDEDALDEAVLDSVELYPDIDEKVPTLVGRGAGVDSGFVVADCTADSVAATTGTPDGHG